MRANLKALLDTVDYDSTEALEVLAIALSNVNINILVGQTVKAVLNPDEIAELIAQLED